MDNETLALIQEIRSNLRAFNLSESALDKLIAKLGGRPVFLRQTVREAIGVCQPPINMAIPHIPAVSPINPMS